MFRDQKIADQNATRRMHRWYMPLFRQFIEWSVLNTGVILREREKGKLLWTGINLKRTLAKELSILGQMETVSRVDMKETDSETEHCETKIRLQKHLLHVPVIQKQRRACRVHKQRKATNLECKVCKKYMCSNICWQRYHSKIDYLLDDPDCTGKVIHRSSID